jgi:hypothetical protein
VAAVLHASGGRYTIAGSSFLMNILLTPLVLEGPEERVVVLKGGGELEGTVSPEDDEAVFDNTEAEPVAEVEFDEVAFEAMLNSPERP